jgi:hypothetical protein
LVSKFDGDVTSILLLFPPYVRKSRRSAFLHEMLDGITVSHTWRKNNVVRIKLSKIAILDCSKEFISFAPITTAFKQIDVLIQNVLSQ